MYFSWIKITHQLRTQILLLQMIRESEIDTGCKKKWVTTVCGERDRRRTTEKRGKKRTFLGASTENVKNGLLGAVKLFYF